VNNIAEMPSKAESFGGISKYFERGTLGRVSV